MAARPRRCCLVVLAGAAMLAGCGAEGPDYRLKTPPPEVVARPIETPAPAPSKGGRDPRPTQRQAERLRPVLAGWAAAVRAGDPDRAARYFAVPAIVAQSMTVELQTRDQVREFNDELPCGARLLEVQHDGRYVVGTFRLTKRAGGGAASRRAGPCLAPASRCRARGRRGGRRPRRAAGGSPASCRRARSA